MSNVPSPGDIVAWTIEAGLRERTLNPVIEGFAARLAALVPGLSRILVAAPTLHPNFVSGTWVWERDRQLETERHGVDTSDSDGWQHSPLRHALDHGLFRMHCDLTDPDEVARFPVFQDFVDRGCTGYLVRLISFEDESRASGAQGLILSFLSDAPGGFGDDDLSAIEKVLPALGIAAFRLVVSDIARNLLEAYLGGDVGRRVLGGKVRRGDVERIRAAILFADLRHFTDTSERMAGSDIVAWLNAGLAALGDPAARHGGEILKFLGDGLLAIFPIEADEADACKRALAAAREALAGLESLSGLPGPKHEADIALHVGEVDYGNVGASDRLDFTVIGATVNEASRMEGLCDLLDVHLVMSARFVSSLDIPVRDLGEHRLRGLRTARRLFTLTES